MNEEQARDMMHRIAALNLGPIPSIEFYLQSPGVTVLVAPNGSGKTILLDAVQAAARGEGKLPLRDRTRKGKVEAFGAVITIGGTCRHTGSFEVTNLEGRFDLAALVDPRIKSPAAADKARIKALVSLTGVEASVNLFRAHEAFEDFGQVVTAEALATDDLVDMAAKIKACYDDAALKAERLSEREFGQATALIPASDVDLDAECDQAVLQEQYNTARDEVTRLAEQARNADKFGEKLQNAQEVLDDMSGEELRAERDELTTSLENVDDAVNVRNGQIQALLAQAEQLRAEVKAIQSTAVTSRARIVSIDRQLKLVEEAKAVLDDKDSLTRPTEKEIADAKEELSRAAEAIELGVKIRSAKANAQKVQQHRTAAKEAQDRAGRYRDAGKATDEVLSGCIRCPQLRVESDGKTARLVTDHPLRGKSIPYHDLSDGERWTIAIDIGADQVGEGGLLVISQIGWEGIDGHNRLGIHEHGVKRGVYILTAEAASDPLATREIIPTPLVALQTPMAKRIEAQAAQAERETSTPEPQKKSPPEKPAKTAPPVIDVFEDDEDIPF